MTITRADACTGGAHPLAGALRSCRSAAAELGTSLQNYLRDVLLAQAAYLRRQKALARTAERLDGRPGVPADERQAVLDAVSDGHSERADQLIDRPSM